MMEWLALPFIQRALLGGVLIGVLCALLGVFVVFRQMAFFSDAISHFSLTGIALGLLLGLDPHLFLIFFCVLCSWGIYFFKERSSVSLDTTIGVFFSGALALGILVIGLLKGYQGELFSYLFGDILAVTALDLAMIGGLGAVVTGVLMYNYQDFLQVSFNTDLAHVAGIRVQRTQYAFMTLLAVTIAVSIQVAGVLLVGALLIIPAAAAKNFSRNLKRMIFLTVLFGCLSTTAGLAASVIFNLAAGPSMVLTGVAIFVISIFSR